MTQTDAKEYGTGSNPNPADIPADIPRKDDWQARMLAGRQAQAEGQNWYPVAQGAPETSIPRRYKAFEADEGSFQASIQPQKWDCTPAIAVPQSGGFSNPIEVAPFLPGRDQLTITNTGANPIVVSPTLEKALNGVGVPVAAGSSFVLNSQAGVWAWATGGASTVQAWWTQYEAPTSHLPPKDKEG